MPTTELRPKPSCFTLIEKDATDRDGLPQWVGLWKYTDASPTDPTQTSKPDQIWGEILENVGKPIKNAGKKSDDPKPASTHDRPLAKNAEWVFRGQESSTWEVMPSTRRSREPKGCPSQPFFSLEAGLVEGLSRLSFGERGRLLEQVKKAVAGQGVAEWAKVHTIGNPGPTDPQWHEIAPLLHAIRCAAEFQAVHDFARVADDAGLLIHDSISSLPNGADSLANGESAWEPSETTALAQHHGIGTKLLDWTRRVKVAAYFATQPKETALLQYTKCRVEHEVALQTDAKGEFAIWALNAACLITGPVSDRRDLSRVRVLECNQATNHFLHAQDGLFTWFDERSQLAKKQKKRRYPSIVDVLAAEGFAEDGVLQKFVVPRKLAAELRSRLRADRISRATVMPTYDHVAISVRHRWFDRTKTK